MASITPRKTKNSTVYDIQICLTKTDRRKLYAFTNKRIAERFGEKLEDLLSSRRTGIPNREVQEWLLALAQTDPQRYDKLVSWGLAEPRKTNGTLQALTAKYLDDPDVKETTLGARKVTCKRLLRFFRPDRQVTTITDDDANQFYLWLQKNFAVGTYGRDIKRVKQIFKLAGEDGLILRNPFRNFRGSSTTDRSRFHYVTIEDTQKILDEITDPQLRLAFVLARFGGLRIPSELRFMEWKDVDLTSNKFYVKMPKKTNKHQQAAGNFTTRAVPLFPEVRQAFMDYFESLPEGSPALIFGDVKFKSLRRKFQRALDRAGIPAWEKFFQNMRSTRETELAEKYPLQDVTAWLGNSPAVAQKHYLQVKSTNFQLASETETIGHFIGHKKGQHCNVETCRNMNENEEVPCFTTQNALLNINLLESACPTESPSSVVSKHKSCGDDTSSVVNPEGRRPAVRGGPGRRSLVRD